MDVVACVPVFDVVDWNPDVRVEDEEGGEVIEEELVVGKVLVVVGTLVVLEWFSDMAAYPPAAIMITMIMIMPIVAALEIDARIFDLAEYMKVPPDGCLF